MVEPFSNEYLKLMEHKKIPLEAMEKLPQVMNLIKVVPETYDYLDSEKGFDSPNEIVSFCGMSMEAARTFVCFLR